MTTESGKREAQRQEKEEAKSMQRAKNESIRLTILFLSLLGILAGLLVNNGEFLRGMHFALENVTLIV